MMRTVAKEIFWVGSALEDLRALPADARSIAGHQLRLVQQGLEPDDWKPMGDVGPGVYELRVHTAVEHRVFYVAKFVEGIYVLHAFQKKTRQTSARDLELARERYRAIVKHRQETGLSNRRK
jgi:phage-related protein